MWSLFITEIKYHRRLFIGFLATAPVLAWVAIHPFTDDLPVTFWTFIMIFLMLQNWVSFRNKEKRERLRALLPVTPWKIALIRFALIIFPGILFATLFVILKRLLDPLTPSQLSQMMKGLAVLFTGFAGYFVIRDQLLVYFRRRGISKSGVTVGLMFFILGLNLLGILALFKADAGLLTYGFIDKVMYFIIGSNPFAGAGGILKFALLCFMLTAVTLLSYRQRKSFLE